PGGALRPDQLRFLEAMANQLALALERGELAEQAERTRGQVEAERMKNTLLSSVSHDIRTPLAAITGAATSLLSPSLDEDARHELATTIAEESQRLSRQVGNLLDMTRLESGAIEVHKEWAPLEEVVGAALERLAGPLAGRVVHVDIPPGLFVPLDEVLVSQVVFNLVENAIKYSPPSAPIDIRALKDEKRVTVEVLDRGRGLPPGSETRVFDKFYRGAAAGSPRGIGLGLSICRGFVEAQGGDIEAANRPGGGAIFRFRLPLEGEPPRVEAE